MRQTTEKKQWILLFYFIIISVLELLAYGKKGIFSIAASRLWLFTGLLFLLIFTYMAAKKLIEDIKNKAFFPLAGFLILIGFFCYFIGNLKYSDINPDATQQVAAGLASFSYADLNYTGTAFLGYANRQYIIAALPAMLFGRSVLTLHLGFAYPFLIGLTMLFLELREWMKREGLNEALALLPVYALFSFRFITEYFLNFEQAITPVALTMMGIALFLRLCRKPDVLSFFLLSFVGCLFCDSYTPVIASLGLLLCFLTLYILKLFFAKYFVRQESLMAAEPVSSARNITERIPLAAAILGLILNITCFFAATLLVSRADRLDSVRQDVSLVPFALKTWLEFFTDANAGFLGMFLLPVILYLLLSLLGRLKFHDFTISCWVFGVVLFANYMTGYDTSYEKSWILQRNMIILPVLITGMFFALIRMLRKYRCRQKLRIRSANLKLSKTVLALFLCFFAFAGLFHCGQEHHSFRYFQHVQPIKFMIAYTEDTLKEYGIKDTDRFSIVLYTDNLWQSNLRDYATFFYPNASIYSLTSKDTLPELEPDIPAFIFSETEQEITSLGFPAENRTYKNPRYKTAVTWYRTIWSNDSTSTLALPPHIDKG